MVSSPQVHCLGFSFSLTLEFVVTYDWLQRPPILSTTVSSQNIDLRIKVTLSFLERWFTANRHLGTSRLCISPRPFLSLGFSISVILTGQNLPVAISVQEGGTSSQRVSLTLELGVFLPTPSHFHSDLSTSFIYVHISYLDLCPFHQLSGTTRLSISSAAPEAHRRLLTVVVVMT